MDKWHIALAARLVLLLVVVVLFVLELVGITPHEAAAACRAALAPVLKRFEW